jgi:Sulfotransferase domain.
MTDLSAPNFLVAGAQKAGTTYLCDKLSRHPDIFITAQKEPLFFQRRFSKDGYGQYLSTHFSAVRNETWIGEGSTTYFQAPLALKNIARVLSPDLKVIICLRQPTEKAVSAYLHNWRRGRYPTPVSILDAPAIAHGLAPRLSSLYYDHVCRWLSVFPRHQIEFLLFDKLRDDPAAFVSQALDFLGVEGAVEADREPINKGSDIVWDGDVLTVRNRVGPGGQASARLNCCSCTRATFRTSICSRDYCSSEFPTGRSSRRSPERADRRSTCYPSSDGAEPTRRLAGIHATNVDETGPARSRLAASLKSPKVRRSTTAVRTLYDRRIVGGEAGQKQLPTAVASFRPRHGSAGPGQDRRFGRR